MRKLTRHHMVFCAKSSLTCSRAKFSSRVHLDLEASRMFRPTPRKNIWSHFVQAYCVRTLAYGTWLRSLINALVSGLESMRALRSESKHGIMRLLCDDRRNEVRGIPAVAGACGCTLLWIWTELPVHAPCLDWSRFGRSRQEAHTVSYDILRKVEPDR